ncbi:SocA family protein [Gemmata sp. G18]|uniref:SocA family protein n=1 Tax=Gemmata palustris TaxID=2822762 RepID=A0ABS5BUX4_9BACT|nr:Panacea domain-containing protein [Gemmata palustris]MBP3957488.1 SocA family protein [Gemmata palustris]
MLTFKFKFPKAFQAAAVVLREHGGRANFIRLLKLLYITDRELLAQTGRTLTGDEAIALPKGPALKTVHNLINGRGPNDEQTEWNGAMHRAGDDVLLDRLVPTGKLTKAEERKLHEVCERFRETSTEALWEQTHTYGEWKEAYAAEEANPINWEVALADQGAGALVGEVRHIQHEAELIAATFSEPSVGRR